MFPSKLIIVLVIFISFFSCTNGGDKNKTSTATNPVADSVPVVSKENFPKGEIIEKVECKSDASQSYAMYLPSNYSTEKKFPVIIAFDPHATGKLPVSNYKDLAEQYGYIIIGSNNSKNGNDWKESETISEKLLTEVRNRLSVNLERIYLLGFSGGSRVANGITITNGAIAGVICCGGSAPGTNSSNPRNNYTLIGIAGTEDFNYTEMRKYDMIDLAGHNVKHALITFDGKHEWPPKETMDKAFWWLELNEMRKNPAAKNQALITEKITPIFQQIESLKTNKKLFEAFNLTKQTITFYDGLADLSGCIADYKAYKNNDEIGKALAAEEQSWSKEEDLKQKFMKGFQMLDFNKWQKDITDLNQKIKTGKDKTEVLINKRVLNYLSLAAYMQASGALKQNAMQAADYFCKIYVLVDPDNSEAHYLSANVNAREGKPKDAIAFLNLAVKNGFNDLPRLQSDADFEQMKNTPEFQEVVKRIKASYPK